MHKDAPLDPPPSNPPPNTGDPNTQPPGQQSLVTGHGGVDTSGMPPVDESGLPASRIIGHEQYEIGLNGIFKFMVWFVLIVGLTFVLIYFVQNAFTAADRTNYEVRKSALATTQPVLPPEPRLQPSRGMEMMEWDYKQRIIDDYNRVLNNYGWVDKAAGTVHVPVDKAMEMALKDPKVLPARAGGKAPGSGIVTPGRLPH
jgi:hypothetical protein